ncbi:MAG: SDR family oxidoreductase [Kiritimatiellia bacterium]|nr:SDR family oxidoreductase [Kiritimatiellia bacterium]
MSLRVLVLGGFGMLGHKVTQVLSREFDAAVSFRREPHDEVLSLMESARKIFPVDAADLETVASAIDGFEPSVVINCIGVVKQLAAGKDPITCITVNSLFPHQLENLCRSRGIRLICISTDCVFSGLRGGYIETDVSDAADLYGRTKFLGEVTREGTLTLRTSIIGRELVGAHGLVEWFLSQEGRTIKGFSKAIFSGVTTRVLANIILQILTDHGSLHGVYHVAAEPIRKYDLLTVVRDEYGLDVTIEADDSLVCDRSLNGNLFRDATRIETPSWIDMIRDMHNDPTPYNQLRGELIR